MTTEEYYKEHEREFERALELLVLRIGFIFKDMGLLWSYEYRLKTLTSLIEKVRRKKILVSEIPDKIKDIAGARLIIKYRDWIPMLVEELKKIPNLEVIGIKDYNSEPKQNGYSGYHLYVRVLTPMKDGSSKMVPVEIQIRTLPQHVWATIEHEFRYSAAKAGKEVGNKRINWLFRRLANVCALADKLTTTIRLVCAETKKAS